MPVAINALAIAALVFVAVPQPVLAQGEITGRVTAADSARPPVAGVEASIAKLGRTVLSDSTGRFRLKDVPPGEHMVVMRAVGFRAESSKVFIDRDEVVSWDVVLNRAEGAVLPERVVTAPEERVPTKLLEFMDRQKLGTGRFITREQLARAEGGRRLTGDVISTVSGVLAKRGTNKIWIASGRAAYVDNCEPETLAKRALPDPKCDGRRLNYSDFIAGARPACFMDVYLDGNMVFNSMKVENGLFDVNTVPPEHIAGIEVYSSTAQVPAKYNRTGGVCGVLLIWTR
jgi:hypothetical protein